MGIFENVKMGEWGMKSENGRMGINGKMLKCKIS